MLNHAAATTTTDRCRTTDRTDAVQTAAADAVAAALSAVTIPDVVVPVRAELAG